MVKATMNTKAEHYIVHNASFHEFFNIHHMKERKKKNLSNEKSIKIFKKVGIFDLARIRTHIVKFEKQKQYSM